MTFPSPPQPKIIKEKLFNNIANKLLYGSDKNKWFPKIDGKSFYPEYNK